MLDVNEVQSRGQHGTRTHHIVYVIHKTMLTFWLVRGLPKLPSSCGLCAGIAKEVFWLICPSALALKLTISEDELSLCKGSRRGPNPRELMGPKSSDSGKAGSSWSLIWDGGFGISFTVKSLGSFHTKRKASPIFLLGAPPWRETSMCTIWAIPFTNSITSSYKTIGFSARNLGLRPFLGLRYVFRWSCCCRRPQIFLKLVLLLDCIAEYLVQFHRHAHTRSLTQI